MMTIEEINTESDKIRGSKAFQMGYGTCQEFSRLNQLSEMRDDLLSKDTTTRDVHGNIVKR